jgi:hypothetical protein
MLTGTLCQGEFEKSGNNRRKNQAGELHTDAAESQAGESAGFFRDKKVSHARCNRLNKAAVVHVVAASVIFCFFTY